MSNLKFEDTFVTFHCQIDNLMKCLSNTVVHMTQITTTLSYSEFIQKIVSTQKIKKQKININSFWPIAALFSCSLDIVHYITFTACLSSNFSPYFYLFIYFSLIRVIFINWRQKRMFYIQRLKKRRVTHRIQSHLVKWSLKQRINSHFTRIQFFFAWTVYFRVILNDLMRVFCERSGRIMPVCMHAC